MIRRSPPESAGVRRSPPDSNAGMCWCDMGQFFFFSPVGVRRSPVESADSTRLHQTQPGLSPGGVRGFHQTRHNPDSVHWTPPDSIKA
jgi:hypothetical protein